MAEIISESEIRKHLSNNINAFFEIHDSISSTNIRAKELAKSGAKDFTVVISDHQSEGHGRFGRDFFSPSGKGIYMSIILRPDIDISQVSNITSFTAVACSRAIENLCDCCVGIKWVNDLFINGKKICGILAEAATEPKTLQMTYVVIGIGIDLLHVEPPEELIDVISSVEDQTGKRISREELIAEILNRFNGFQNSLCSKTYMEEYRTRSIIIGKSIKIVSSNETFEAIARQIDDTGALIVEHDGILRKINAGEVSIRF